jgi:predicted metal-dependent peptidase
LKEPFYSHVLACLNKIVVDKNYEVQTLAVGILYNNHALYINPDFWSNFLINPKHRYGVLKHEIIHIILKHTLVHEPFKDRLLINIAMDLVVNQYVARENLPDGSIFLKTFPELNLAPEKSWQYYYDKLIDFKRKQLNSKNESNHISAGNLSRITGDNFGMDRHQLWKFDEKITGADRVLIDNILDSIIRIARNKTTSNFWGNMPSNLQRHIDGILIKPVSDVHWRSMMKIFTASSNKTYVKNSIKRVSKR